MRRRLALLLLVVAALATAGGGAARTDQPAARAGFLPGNLDDALSEIEWALDHEQDAGDALDEGGHFADYYGDDQLRDALDHLDRALADLADAVTAGEIDPDAAAHIADHIHAAISQDEDALDTIEGGGRIDHALSHVTKAIDQKEIAGDLIYYGEDIVTGGLGCTLSWDSIGGGDYFVGFDGCTKSIAKLVIDPGFTPMRVDQASVGSGNRVVSRFPCTRKNSLISCVPPQPTTPPQYIFVDFGPVPAVVTPARALAFGTNGTVQIEPFTFGTAQATSDLSLTRKLFQVTPRGFTTPKKMSGSLSLGAGQIYGFDFAIRNDSTSAATNVKVDISLPTGFRQLGIYPKTCKPAGSTVTCPLGTLTPVGADSVIVWGTLRSTGALKYGASVTSDAAEPSPDPNPNSTSTRISVYGVPTAVLDTLSRSILTGGRGAINGHAVPGSTFKPALERVTKVEVAFLRLTNTRGKCQWLTRSGKFSASKKHIKACDKAIWLPAKGTSKWTFSLPKGLGTGRYEVLARATNAAGITASTFSQKQRSETILTIKR